MNNSNSELSEGFSAVVIPFLWFQSLPAGTTWRPHWVVTDWNFSWPAVSLHREKPTRNPHLVFTRPDGTNRSFLKHLTEDMEAMNALMHLHEYVICVQNLRIEPRSAKGIAGSSPDPTRSSQHPVSCALHHHMSACELLPERRSWRSKEALIPVKSFLKNLVTSMHIPHTHTLIKDASAFLSTAPVKEIRWMLRGWLLEERDPNCGFRICQQPCLFSRREVLFWPTAEAQLSWGTYCWWNGRPTPIFPPGECKECFHSHILSCSNFPWALSESN